MKHQEGSRKRAAYQKYIWEYKKRLDVTRQQYLKAQESIRTLKRRIKQWTTAINHIDEKHKKIDELIKEVDAFFHVKIKSEINTPDHDLARKIFYKVAIEQKMSADYISRYIGRYSKAAFRGRLSLQKSFDKKPENKKAFYDFKRYFEQNDFKEAR